jgi:hypothetical protein
MTHSKGLLTEVLHLSLRDFEVGAAADESLAVMSKRSTEVGVSVFLTRGLRKGKANRYGGKGALLSSKHSLVSPFGRT